MNKKVIVFFFFLFISLKTVSSEEEQPPLKKSKVEAQEPKRSARIRENKVKRLRKYDVKELSELVEAKKVCYSDLSLLSQEEKNKFLLQAFRGNDTNMVANLLKVKADPNACDEKGVPLLVLTVSDWYGLHFCDNDEYNKKVHADYQQNYPTMTKLLIEAKANVNMQGGKRKLIPLSCAARDNYANRFFRSQYYDEDRYVKSLSVNSEVIKLLLEGQAIPNCHEEGSYYYPLHYVVTIPLFDQGDNGDRKTLHLVQTYSAERYKQAKLLLGSKADPNIVDWQGNTPLHYLSLSSNCCCITQLLLMFKGDVTKRNQESWQPIHLAARKNNIGFIGLLLQYGANFSETIATGDTIISLTPSQPNSNIQVNTLNFSRSTLMSLKANGLAANPFLLACASFNFDRVAALIELKADVNQVDSGGRTGLMLVAEKLSTPIPEMFRDNGTKIMQLLLAAGVDPLQEAKNGQTVLSASSPLTQQMIRNHVLKERRKEVYEILKAKLVAENDEESLANLILEQAGTYEPI